MHTSMHEYTWACAHTNNKDNKTKLIKKKNLIFLEQNCHS